jgi:hypothetical protein
MALVHVNGRLYYTKSIRVGGRVTSMSYGPVPSKDARLMVAMDRLVKKRKEVARGAFRALVEEDERIDACLVGLAKEALGAASEALERAGCHQHARGVWRRRRGYRMAKTETEQVETVRVGDEEPREMVDRATGGRFIESWAALLAIRRTTKNSRLSRDLVWQDLAVTAEELAGPDPTPTERLLARAAAADWLAWQMYRADYEFACRPNAELSAVVSEHHQKRIDRTHRRMLRSIKMLETVRRLVSPAPTIRVRAAVANIAQVTGPVAPPGRQDARREANEPTAASIHRPRPATRQER